MTLSVLTHFGSQAEAAAAARALASGQATVTSAQTDIAEDPPPIAFNTALMLQAANAELGWTSAQTMRVAQRLFEGVTVQGRRIGLVTYPRTTGTTAVTRVVREARQMVSRLSGQGGLAPQLSLLGEAPRWPLALRLPAGQTTGYAPIVDGARRVWAWAQNGLRRIFGCKPVASRGDSESHPEAAHECIRPTALTRSPETLRGHLDPDTLALYTLIYRRFLDSQWRGPRYRVTTIEVEYDDEAVSPMRPIGQTAAPAVDPDITDW
jgi:DNA topoisomerase-1